MNEKRDPLYPFGSLTLTELIEAIQELLRDALAVVSASRKSKPKILDGSFSAPLARDLLLSWASQAMAGLVQLQFWTETSEYASGQLVKTIGTSFTHGSVLVMNLISVMPNVLFYTERVSDLYGLPEYIYLPVE